MADKLYTRVRGQIRGPFAQEKLRQLVKRGQLTRIHEVSADGTKWQKAAEFEELFQSESPSVQGHAQPAQEAEPEDYSLRQQQPASSSKSEQWYYAQDQQQFGPVDFDRICDLVASGQIRQEDEVWTHGMQDWVKVKDHPHLTISMRPVVVTNESQSERYDSDKRGRSKNEIGGQIVRTLSDSTGWLTFITIIGYTYGGLLLLGAFFLMLAGASERAFPVVGMGIVNLVYAGVTITGSILLNRHISAIGNFIRVKDQTTLDIALRRIRAFWVFISIVLTVILVNTIAVVVWISLFFAQIASVLQ